MGPQWAMLWVDAQQEGHHRSHHVARHVGGDNGQHLDMVVGAPAGVITGEVIMKSSGEGLPANACPIPSCQ